MKTVLGAVAAVDETVDAVRRPGRTTMNGTEAIAPRRVAVVFAKNSAVMNLLFPIRMKVKWTTLILLPGTHHTGFASFGRTSGA